jgi:hypothetical protein
VLCITTVVCWHYTAPVAACQCHHGELVEWCWQGETGGGRPVPVPLFPPQIPGELAWDRNRVSAIRGRRPAVLSINFEVFWRRLPMEYLNSGLVGRLNTGVHKFRVLGHTGD